MPIITRTNMPTFSIRPFCQSVQVSELCAEYSFIIHHRIDFWELVFHSLDHINSIDSFILLIEFTWSDFIITYYISVMQRGLPTMWGKCEGRTLSIGFCTRPADSQSDRKREITYNVRKLVERLIDFPLRGNWWAQFVWSPSVSYQLTDRIQCCRAHTTRTHMRWFQSNCNPFNN